MNLLSRFSFLLLVLLTAPAQALTPELAKAIVIGDSSSRIEAMQQAVQQPDEQLAALLQALADGAVKRTETQVFIVRDDRGADPVTGQVVAIPDDAEDVINNNRMRGEIARVQAALALFNPDAKARLAAARALMTHTQLRPAEIVRAGLEIAGDLCIYTNRNIEVHELT